MNKSCSKCKNEKSLLKFSKDKYKKDGYDSWCKECRSNYCEKYWPENKNRINQEKREITRTKHWKMVFHHIKQRCNNKNNDSYKYYGGKGIKALITEEEIKKIWFRDKAYLMKKPSIDRKNSNGNYCYDNCEFIEHSLNSAKDKEKVVLQYKLNGDFIRQWKSMSDAGRSLNICISNISVCTMNGRNNTAGGFIWKRSNNDRR